MFCSKCEYEIKDGEKFCGNCGKKIKDNESNSNGNKDKTSKMNKKLICIIIGIVIIVGVVLGVAVLNNRNTNVDTNTNTDISTNSNNIDNTQSETQDFKYVQKDDKSYSGNSFKNVNFDTFKNNLRQLWFKGDLEYDIVMQRNIGMFGEEYSQWQVYNDKNGETFEELKNPYLKGNSYIIGRMVDIYYTENKTNVYGFAIYISDYYLGKVGRSNLTSLFFEVIDCLPNDFAEEVKERYYSDIQYEDFFVTLSTINLKNLNNEPYHMLVCFCKESTSEINIKDQTDTTKIDTNDNTNVPNSNANNSNDNASTNINTSTPTSNNNNSSTSTPSSNSNNSSESTTTTPSNNSNPSTSTPSSNNNNDSNTTITAPSNNSNNTEQNQTQYVNVPNLVGLDYTTALTKMQECGITHSITEHLYTPNKNKDYTIAHQSQKAGSKVEEGTNIDLKMYDGSDSIVARIAIKVSYKNANVDELLRKKNTY